MSSILKRDKTSMLKKRICSHLSVKIDTTAVLETDLNYSEEKPIDSETSNESFFESVWPVMAVAQYMGFMPVNGIRTGNPSQFIFHWKTIPMMITAIYILLGSFVALMYLNQIIRMGITAKNIVGFVFFSCCLFSGILFLFLARKWRDIALVWSKCERVFLNLPYKECGCRLSTKLRIAAASILCFAMLEHMMFLSSSMFNFVTKINVCKIDIDDPWKYYFMNEHPHIFKVLPYHIVFTILVEWVNISFTFGWNYMDAFIIITSIGLSTRFQQINYRLEAMKKKSIDESTWAEVRHHYVLLCELVELIDKHLASLILLSCANNLYFICFQLLNIFNKLPFLINYLYFWYSLLYLIGRTTAVFLIASGLNDAAKFPLTFVRQRKTTEWCVELERFGDQISTEVVALSGMKFFFITRSLLFGMAGTIVTYELVLLQFDEGTKQSGIANFCDGI